jgi:putative inorganic carbon (HCO3(-)) transporter
MSARTLSAATVVGIPLALGAFALAPPGGVEMAIDLYGPAAALVALGSGAFLVWRVHPAYTLSAAIFLTPLAGNWPRLGVPGPLSPDRLLFAAAIVAVLLRAPPVADRPRLRISGAHWLLALASGYALVSAFFAETLFQRDGFFRLLDALGILPFLTFLIAPIAFRTPAQRRILLGTLVALGAYLSLTVLFDFLKLDALVFPKYILDQSYGIHSGRGRGPFVDAVASGLALFTCGVACVVAVATWRNRPMRRIAAVVGVLCVVGAFLSLERSVWIGAVAATTVAMLAMRGMRRYFVPVVVAVAVAIVGALTLIPGLSEVVSDRLNDSRALWDRKNLNRAAVNMIEARPLTGFGWSRFETYSADYFEQAADYPLTATGVSEQNERRFGVHNTPLTYGVDLGLVGLTLWLLGVMYGVGGALASRGPPDLLPWRVGLLAVALATLVVINATPPSAWANRSLWLLAGVAYAGVYASAGPRPSGAPAPTPAPRG